MGIFNRLGTLFKSNLNDMISKAEDPEKMLNQIILDMKQQLVEAKKQVAVAIADEKRLAKQLESEQEMAKEWEKKAMMAVRAGDDSLAKEALLRKSEHDKLVAEYQKQWTAQADASNKLKDALRTLNSKIEEAQRKKNLLIARAKRAEAQKTIQATMQGLNDTSAFDTFDRMAAKVEQIEAEADAQTELAADMSGQGLQDRFKALEQASGADDQLAALKAKMGIAAGAARPALSTAKTGVNVNIDVAEDAEVSVGKAEAEKEEGAS
ncbi:MAG TPA: PspA/IM30 family protein [Myxococcota bacterium]|jgi:phage shock protein A|nr:PspA/IM30 family protein [Myxococcota bacterium]